MLPRLLGIAMVGFVLFGVTMSLVLSVANRWPALTTIPRGLMRHPPIFLLDVIDSSWGKLAPWMNGQALVLTAAYAFRPRGGERRRACRACYFYCLLAGIRMSMVEVVVHAVKSKAIAAVALHRDLAYLRGARDGRGDLPRR